MPTFGELAKQAAASGGTDEIIPDGDFVVRIERANAGTSNSGDDRIGVMLKVVGADPDDEPLADDDPALGATSWINLYFSEKAFPISLKQLKEFGLSDSFIEQSDSAEQVADALVGTELVASIGHRTWGTDGDRTDNTIKVRHVVEDEPF